MSDFLLFVAIGFAAQLIDGAIGMAYGVTATTVLLSFGIPPAVASASVHAAEVFTSATAGAAHWRLGNIQWSLFRNLAIPGVAGGVVGAYVLTQVPAETIAPLVSIYLFILGGVILVKAWTRRTSPAIVSRAATWALGLIGGCLDAIGGGGWGPIVTSTLIGRGTVPRFAIGSASLTEFFVAASIAGTFVATIGLELWPIITGLIIGGVIAAPLAAVVTRRLPDRPLMVLVGVVVMLLSVRYLLSMPD